MDPDIRKTLLNMSLNFDTETIDEVVNFLNQEIGTVAEEALPYHICAAAAIVSECRIIPSIGSGHGVTNGIKVENIMRHLPGLSKERFLETVTLQINKWTKTPNWLLQRVDALSISYRIFKKYSHVFHELGEKASVEHLLLKQSMQFFWIDYLLVKNRLTDPSNFMDTARLLSIVLRSAFTSYVCNMDISEVKQVLLTNFPEVQEISEQTEVQCELQLYERVEEVYQRRFGESKVDIYRILHNDVLRQRILDDMSNQYDRFYANLPKGVIDEMTYLELNKTLTPQQIMPKPDPSSQVTLKRQIDFDRDDKEDEPFHVHDEKNTATSLKNDRATSILFPKSLSFKRVESPVTNTGSQNRATLAVTISPFRRNPASENETTPISLKLQNMNWVRKCLDSVGGDELNRLERIFSQYCATDYGAFKRKALEGILSVIKQFNPSCRDLAKRQQDMYTLYMYFLGKITGMYEYKENLMIFAKEEAFNSLLCISVELFNYSYQNLTGEFRRYCEIFGIDITSSFKPINWIGKHCELSKSLETHLFLLEKQILIKEIWDDDTGYIILTSQNSDKMGYADYAIRLRLNKHVGERISELCKVVKIEDKYVTMVVSLVNKVISDKPYLLRKNRIDQIIICSVTFCIKKSVNGDSYKLQDIFTMYNSASLSHYSIKDGLISPEGEQMCLLDFYNEVFLKEAQSLIEDDEKLVNVLSTPMRATVIPGSRLLHTPLHISFRDASSTGGFTPNMRIKTESNKDYKTHLAHKLLRVDDNEDQQDESDDDLDAFKNRNDRKGSDMGGESPRFGPPSELKSHFSFGKPN